MATVFKQNKGTVVIKLLMIASAVGLSSPTPTAGKRHAYIHAIPFNHMKLRAPILKSLTNASPVRCGVQCLHEEQCHSFNYHQATKSCQLLSDYLCSDHNELIEAGGYRYYDVDKDKEAEDVRRAQADSKCSSDARCSPKCTCTIIAFNSYLGFYLTPDDEIMAQVPATSIDSCMRQCKAKPLPLCRGVNVRYDSSKCHHLKFLPSERSPARFSEISNWAYYQRQCMN